MTQLSIEEQIKQIQDDIMYYKESKQEKKEDIKIAYALAITSTHFLNGLDKKECEKLRKLISNITNSKFRIKYFIKNDINKMLEKHDNFGNNPSIMEIENKLKHELSKQNVEENNILIKDWVEQIYSDPADRIKKSIGTILTCSKYIKDDQQNINNLKNKLQELKKEQIQEVFDINNKGEKENITKKQTKTKSKTNKTNSEKKKQEERKTISSNKEMLPSEIINYIANKHNSKTTLNSNEDNYLDQEDEELIANYIGAEAYVRTQLFTDVSKTLLEQNTLSVILTKFRNYDKSLIKTKKVAEPTLIELLEMAKITHNSTVNHLLKENIVPTSKHMIIKNATEIRRDPLTYLQKYEEAYNIYIKYYNSLSKEEKEAEKIQAENNKYNYEELHINNFYLLTPEMLKNRINNTIKETLLNDHPIYGNQRDYLTASKIEKATTLMDNEEIKNLYKSMKNRRENTVAYYARINHPLPEKPNWYADLQYNFCNAIFYRQTKDLSKEEIKKINKDKELYKICTEILGEQPLFMTQKYVEEKPKPKTVMEEAALANERFFNMSKIEQTFNRINGNWKKFEEKLEEMVNTESKLTDKEIAEEFKGMFR